MSLCFGLVVTQNKTREDVTFNDMLNQETKKS